MEDFLHFICPWLRVRGGGIFLLVLLCSILTVKAVVNDESSFMCYQGKIITTKAHKISLSKKSLSNFSLQKCQAPTTAEPEPELTTMMPDMSTTTRNTQSSPLTMGTETDITTTVISSTNTLTDHGFLSTDVTTSKDVTTPPTVPTTTTPTAPTIITKSSSQPSPGPNNTNSDKTSITTPSPSSGSGRRRRRSKDDDDTKFTCQVFYYQTNEDSQLRASSTFTLEFSCATEYKCGEAGKVDNVKMDDHTGTLYCCNGTACNSPFIVTDDKEVEVETLKNCSSYNQAGVLQSVPCVQTTTHMCLNVTQKGTNTTEYTCGNKDSERSYCIKHSWYSETCSESDGTTTCCYVEPTFVKAPPEVKPPNSSVGVIIGIIVAFATGLFLGCVGLVILQKKCGKGRTSGIEMDFSYSRFQSADSGTDEL